MSLRLYNSTDTSPRSLKVSLGSVINFVNFEEKMVLISPFSSEERITHGQELCKKVVLDVFLVMEEGPIQSTRVLRLSYGRELSLYNLRPDVRQRVFNRMNVRKFS